MSNLVVKMMSGENHLDDANRSKGFELVESFGEVRCLRDKEDKPIVLIPNADGQDTVYHPLGNTYLLHNGKTVSIFNYSLNKNVSVQKLKHTAQQLEMIGLVIGIHQTKAIHAKNFNIEDFNKASYADQNDWPIEILDRPNKKIYWTSLNIYVIEGKNHRPVGHLRFDDGLSSGQLAVLDGLTLAFQDVEYILHLDLNLNGGKGLILMLAPTK